jgi:hypothetical protein
MGQSESVTVHEQEYPDEGAITVSWQVSLIDARRRLGWKFASEPRLDSRLAIALLRDVANELEEDLPAP